MRIISGERKGLKLYTLEGDNTRPTLDRVKESLFNILDSKQFEYGNVLDLFAGSGALGIEALSRGANLSVFCDSSKFAIEVINKNIFKSKYENKSIVFNIDYITLLEKSYKEQKKFNIIFLDPPYNKGIGIDAIELISRYNLLNQDGIIVLETDEDENISEKIGIYEIIDKRKYGKVRVYLFK